MILEEVGGGKRKLFCTYFKYVLEKNIDFLMHLKGIMLFSIILLEAQIKSRTSALIELWR